MFYRFVLTNNISLFIFLVAGRLRGTTIPKKILVESVCVEGAYSDNERGDLVCVCSVGEVCLREVVGGWLLEVEGRLGLTRSLHSFAISDRVPVVGTHSSRTGSQVSKCPVWLKGYSPAEQRLWWVGEESGRVGWESE